MIQSFKKGSKWGEHKDWSTSTICLNIKKEYLREIVDVCKVMEVKNSDSKTIQRVKNRALYMVALSQLRLDETMMRIYVPQMMRRYVPQMMRSYVPQMTSYSHWPSVARAPSAYWGQNYGYGVCLGPELRRTQRVRGELCRGGEIKLLALQENCRQKMNLNKIFWNNLQVSEIDANRVEKRLNYFFFN